MRWVAYALLRLPEILPHALRVVATQLRLTFRYGSYDRHVAAAFSDVTVSCQSLLLRRVWGNMVGRRYFHYTQRAPTAAEHERRELHSSHP